MRYTLAFYPLASNYLFFVFQTLRFESNNECRNYPIGFMGGRLSLYLQNKPLHCKQEVVLEAILKSKSKPKSEVDFSRLIFIAGICAMLSAITTLLLEYLPVPAATDFESRVRLVESGAYMASKWALFFHPQFTLMSFIGVAILFYRKLPEIVIPGLLFAGIWAVTEATQQALVIDGINQILRSGYLATSDPSLLSEYKTGLRSLSAISDSLFFLLLYAVGIAYLLFGIALLKTEHRSLILAAGMLFLASTSFISFFSYYVTALPTLTSLTDFLFTYGYPYLAPVFRAYFGFWLIKKSGLV